MALLATALALAAAGYGHAWTLGIALRAVSVRLRGVPPCGRDPEEHVRRTEPKGAGRQREPADAISICLSERPASPAKGGRMWTRALEALVLASVAALLLAFAVELWKGPAAVDGNPPLTAPSGAVATK